MLREGLYSKNLEGLCPLRSGCGDAADSPWRRRLPEASFLKGVSAGRHKSFVQVGELVPGAELGSV